MNRNRRRNIPRGVPYLTRCTSTSAGQPGFTQCAWFVLWAVASALEGLTEYQPQISTLYSLVPAHRVQISPRGMGARACRVSTDVSFVLVSDAGNSGV
jgi:hypothetical protein